MQVETYEVEELREESPAEVEAEAAELIERLGLTGQKSLVRDSADGVERVPYRLLTTEEQVVYQAVLPVDTALADYKDGLIPLRVLQVAAHARSLGLELRVWHPREGVDPLLLSREGQQYSFKYRLLARWGEVLEPFDRLKERAKVLIREKLRAAKEREIAQAQADLASLDSLVLRKLAGEFVG